jgi:signal transduction histidine kinase
VNSVTTDEVTARIAVIGDESALHTEMRGEVFLIVRQALRNAFTHAHARKLGARIIIGTDRLRATVVDDGDGFDPTLATSFEGNGVRSMRERTELMGGTFNLASAPHQGTRIEISIPLLRT